MKNNQWQFPACETCGREGSACPYDWSGGPLSCVCFTCEPAMVLCEPCLKAHTEHRDEGR